MAISADNELTWLGPACFWSNHVDNPLMFRTMGCVGNAEIFYILSQGIHLSLGNDITDIVNINGWHVVVKSRKGQVWAPNRSPCIPQSLKGLGTGHLMNVVLVHIEELGLTFLPCNHMAIPELIKNRFATHISSLSIWAIMAAVISLVDALPPRSLVKMPSAKTASTAWRMV